jgi:hypothetical protein
MLAGAENAYFQEEKDGFAKPHGTVMVSNFIIEHNIRRVRDEIKNQFEIIYGDTVTELIFEDWFAKLEEEFGGDVKNLQRIERFVMYSSFRYIVRSRGQIRQRTLRKRISKTFSLK